MLVGSDFLTRPMVSIGKTSRQLVSVVSLSHPDKGTRVSRKKRKKERKKNESRRFPLGVFTCDTANKTECGLTTERGATTNVGSATQDRPWFVQKRVSRYSIQEVLFLSCAPRMKYRLSIKGNAPHTQPGKRGSAQQGSTCTECLTK